ncbi:MAG: cbb3-type cytochrome c oxidase subunit 3 [Pseudomonadota bacterium]
MDTYSLLREFADSWALLALFSFFIGVAVFAFWPSLSAERRDAADIPFRHDRPDSDTTSKETGDE